MLARNSLYLGDCLEVMKQLDDHSIDMILCDLPYGITTCKWDCCIPLDQLWIEYKRILKPGGAVVLTALLPFAARLVMSNVRWFRHELIWEKDNGSNPFNANRMPMRVHENILVFCSKGTIYNPQFTVNKPDYIRAHRGRVKHLGKSNRIDTINKGNRYPRSVLKFSKDYGKLIHSTQKPVKLFEWLIKTYSNPGGLILDNCSGSGTTAIACINSQRDYICIEKDELIFEASRKRISEHSL
jgi:site-specific DNA-methyltransferase (adenine-specific)